MSLFELKTERCQAQIDEEKEKLESGRKNILMNLPIKLLQTSCSGHIRCQKGLSIQQKLRKTSQIIQKKFQYGLSNSLSVVDQLVLRRVQ